MVSHQDLTPMLLLYRLCRRLLTSHSSHRRPRTDCHHCRVLPFLLFSSNNTCLLHRLRTGQSSLYLSLATVPWPWFIRLRSSGSNRSAHRPRQRRLPFPYTTHQLRTVLAKSALSHIRTTHLLLVHHSPRDANCLHPTF